MAIQSHFRELFLLDQSFAIELTQNCSTFLLKMKTLHFKVALHITNQSAKTRKNHYNHDNGLHLRFVKLKLKKGRFNFVHPYCNCLTTTKPTTWLILWHVAIIQNVVHKYCKFLVLTAIILSELSSYLYCFLCPPQWYFPLVSSAGNSCFESLRSSLEVASMPVSLALQMIWFCTALHRQCRWSWPSFLMRCSHEV